MTQQPWWTIRKQRWQANRFAHDFAARSNTTVETLAAFGRFPEPCHCESSLCKGWAMGHQQEDAMVTDLLFDMGLALDRRR